MASQQYLNQIQSLAYRLWQERGCPAGLPKIDWYHAERALAGGSMQDAWTFPENNVDNTDIGSPLEVLSMNLESDDSGQRVATINGAAPSSPKSACAPLPEPSNAHVSCTYEYGANRMI